MHTNAAGNVTRDASAIRQSISAKRNDAHNRQYDMSRTFRNHMRKRWLDPFDLIHHDVFDLTEECACTSPSGAMPKNDPPF